MIVDLKNAGSKEDIKSEVELAKLREKIRNSGARVSKRAKDPKWEMVLVYVVVIICAPFMAVAALFGAIFNKIRGKK